MASSSLRFDTEPEDELDAALFPEAGCASSPNESCGGVVEDELLRELADNLGRTRGTEVVRLAENTLPNLGQSWLLTADPLIGVSAVFAKLAWRGDRWRFLELLHGYEQIQVMNEHLCLIVCVHFTIGCKHDSEGSGPSQCVEFI